MFLWRRRTRHLPLLAGNRTHCVLSGHTCAPHLPQLQSTIILFFSGGVEARWRRTFDTSPCRRCSTLPMPARSRGRAAHGRRSSSSSSNGSNNGCSSNSTRQASAAPWTGRTA